MQSGRARIQTQADGSRAPVPTMRLCFLSPPSPRRTGREALGSVIN